MFESEDGITFASGSVNIGRKLARLKVFWSRISTDALESMKLALIIS